MLRPARRLIPINGLASEEVPPPPVATPPAGVRGAPGVMGGGVGGLGGVGGDTVGDTVGDAVGDTVGDGVAPAVGDGVGWVTGRKSGVPIIGTSWAPAEMAEGAGATTFAAWMRPWRFPVGLLPITQVT